MPSPQPAVSGEHVVFLAEVLKAHGACQPALNTATSLTLFGGFLKVPASYSSARFPKRDFLAFVAPKKALTMRSLSSQMKQQTSKPEAVGKKPIFLVVS